MSKSKQRNVDQIFELKREIKQLQETIKKLERELKNEAKVEKKEKATKTVEVKVPEGGCPECRKGKLKTIDLGVRTLVTCEECKYRKTTKNG
jgi:predicted RNase H-like nuclease (RuvC/YqgF family)